MQAATGEQLTLTAGLDATVSIGPVSAAVTNLGLRALLDSAPGGNLGALNLTLEFKPPDGIGVSMDADPVSGTGFIAFDEADGRYLGALALAVGDVSIEAVGVLDTRLPGGAKGYSLVVVAAATFPPVQLGFGFALDGIGGLIGVNRTLDLPSLQATARAGHLDDLMFPADLANRAPQAAANLAAEFPAAQGHFVIGPAVRLQWGTDGLLDAEIGVFIELSDGGGRIALLRVALLGWVHLTLPDADAPVADLTLDVLGVVDLAAKRLSLDAGLRNSTVAGFPLTGQAALAGRVGREPGVRLRRRRVRPALRRARRVPDAAAGDDGHRRRRAPGSPSARTSRSRPTRRSSAARPACTPSAGPAAVNASLSFDALLQFKPFGLTIDLTITAAVLLDGNAIMSLDLDLHVKGPQPWTVTGRASFHVLFCSFTVPIAITVGPQPQPATADARRPDRQPDHGSIRPAQLADQPARRTGPGEGARARRRPARRAPPRFAHRPAARRPAPAAGRPVRS